MPDKKKQHYVPKFYMKNFSNQEGKFYVYNINRCSQYGPVPYKNQCYSDYFYGNEGTMEADLSVKENEWSKIFNKITNKDSLENDDIILLKNFALYQKQRTLAEFEFNKQTLRDSYIEMGKTLLTSKGYSFDDEAKKICEKQAENNHNSIELINRAVENNDLLEDLEFLLVRYNTKNSLISSDAPVVFINPFYSFGLGLGCMGLIILFPINSKTLVVFYDGNMYTNFVGTKEYESNNEIEVFNLNKLQYMSANKIIFSLEKISENFINEDLMKKRNMCRDKSPIEVMGPEDRKIIAYHTRRVLCEDEFVFSKIPHCFKRIPYPCREAPQRKHDEQWEEKLRNKWKIINATVLKSDKNHLINVGLSKNDYKRGFERMYIESVKYWQRNNTRK